MISPEQEAEFLSEYNEWKVVENEYPKDAAKKIRELHRLYTFKDFEAAWRFMNRVVEEGIRPYDHHPRWQNSYKQVEIWLTSHDVGDQLSKRDIRLAKLCEAVWKELSA